MKHYRIIPFLLVLMLSCKQESYHTITTHAQPVDGGDIVMTPSSSTALDGTSVTFTAQPKGDYIFTGWSGSVSGTENPKTITVSSDINVTATFTLRQYPLTLSTEGEGTVSERVISTKTDYASGTVGELTAKAADHWVFDHWEGDLSGSNNPAQVAISSAKTVKAVFVKKMYDLTIEIEGEGSVEEVVVETKSSSYQEGSVVQLTASPNTYWTFDHWEGDLTGTDNPSLITISSATTVKAVFIEHDPGIAFTETEFISPESVFKWLGMGWNIGGNMDSVWQGVSGETFNGNLPATQDLFNKVKAAGFKSVRIPVCWIGQFDSSKGYQINKCYEERL